MTALNKDEVTPDVKPENLWVELTYLYEYKSIVLRKMTISAGCSSAVGMIKITANRYLSRIMITIITTITNAM